LDRIMIRIAARFGRFAVTAVMVLAAIAVGWRLWVHFMDEPWTRDGRVRADIVGVAPDVSGLISEVLARDNQDVAKGDVILRIDPARFQLALRQAQAVVDARSAALVEAVHEAARYRALTSLSVSEEKQQQTEAAQAQATAAYQQAVADRDLAQLNLDRTTVTAPVAGRITNFDQRPGNYVTAGHAVTALVDAASLRVEGYFEETKLSRIAIGAPATVRLLGERVPLHGHVESIAGGVQDRERAEGPGLLANVNPTFSWVRLAQRVPVRIALDDKPPGVLLLPGRTATVIVQTDRPPPSLMGMLRGGPGA
jgi:RND family efflux transporter MFP subunit